jgi:hypothetical protein
MLQLQLKRASMTLVSFSGVLFYNFFSSCVTGQFNSIPWVPIAQVIIIIGIRGK